MADVDIPDNEYTRQLTTEEWQRALRGQSFRVLVTEEQIAWAGSMAKSCLGCGNVGRVYGDPQRAWCPTVKRLRSNSFPVLCPQWKLGDKGK